MVSIAVYWCQILSNCILLIFYTMELLKKCMLYINCNWKNNLFLKQKKKRKKEVLPNQSPAGSRWCHHFQWGVITNFGGSAKRPWLHQVLHQGPIAANNVERFNDNLFGLIYKQKNRTWMFDSDKKGAWHNFYKFLRLLGENNAGIFSHGVRSLPTGCLSFKYTLMNIKLSMLSKFFLNLKQCISRMI